VKVRVEYSVDLESVREALLAVAADHPQVLRNPAPEVRLKGFGESALDFVMKFWTGDIRGLPRITAELNLAVAHAFRSRGIEIPFPQRTVHLAPAAPPGSAPLAPPGEAPPEPAATLIPAAPGDAPPTDAPRTLNAPPPGTEPGATRS
jgi:potassium efflux system protein